MNNFKISSINSRRNGSKKKKFQWVKTLILSLVFLIFFSLVASSLFIFWIIKDLPNLSNIQEIIFAQSSVIYDRNGVELYNVHGDENRKVVSIDKIPDSLIQSTIAIEDADFFEHSGFSVKGYIKAIFSDVIHLGAHKRGGSTVTQQFIKNTFLTSEKTYIRKIKELILALQLEWKYSKDEILGMYFNSIPYGSNAYGVEQASRMFFGKSVNQINMSEAVILASLPKAPSYYSPYGSHLKTTINLPEEDLKNLPVETYADLLDEVGEENIILGLLLSKITIKDDQEIILPGRVNLVLNRMLELSYLTEEEKQKLEKELLDFKFVKHKIDIKAPHFVLYVRDLLEERYGKEIVNAGGLKIYTTLDYKLQQKAEEIVASQAEKNEKNYGAKNAALISVIPKTGEIITMVGSRDYWDEENDGNVNVHLQRRLPGSSFKPFAYAAAFSAGYSPATVVFDLETDFGNEYKPQNYDGSFRGPLTFRKALGNSLNIPAVKAGIVGGLNRTYNLAKGMGVSFLKNSDWYGSAISLGVAEIRPIDMAQAYAVFANLGKKVEINPFLKIIDRNGNILEALQEKEGKQVLDEETAYLITDVLSDDRARGPGWNTRLQLPDVKNAVKTGTSNKKKQDEVWPLDGWTIGYTDSLLTVAWAGNNDGSNMNKKGSGFSTAAPIWREFMIKALEQFPSQGFQKPEGIKSALVSILTGKLPDADFPPNLVRKEIFSTLNLPEEYDDSLEFIFVDRISGDLPNEYTPEAAKKKVALVHFRPLKDDPNWEKPIRSWTRKYANSYLKSFGVNNVIASVPEKVSTVHNKQNTSKPLIKITSPVDLGEVGKKGVGVWVDINSKHGVSFVEYFLNGELVYTEKEYPYKGNISFVKKTKVGDKFTIKAKMYDTLYNSTYDEITVTVTKDSEPPHAEIIFPKKEAEVLSESVVTLQTYVYDTKSDIQRVDFFLNDRKMTFAKDAPYSASIKMPTELGQHLLKIIAYDQAANSAENEININVVAKKIATELKVVVDKKIKFGQSAQILFSVPAEDVEEIKKVILISRYNPNKAVKPNNNVLIEVDNVKDSSGIFEYLWVRPLEGKYSVFIKTIYDNNKVLFSPKVNVEVK